MPKVATNCNLRKRCLTLIDVLACARLKPTNDVRVCVCVCASACCTGMGSFHPVTFTNIHEALVISVVLFIIE